MLDSFGRNIEYIRISLTNRCNLKCIYCMPECIAINENSASGIMYNNLIPDEENINLSSDEIIKILKSAVSLGIKKVRYTGGEPLIYRDIEKLIKNTSAIREIEDISITTNGILLKDRAAALKRAGLKRVNISLDTLQKNRYKKITRGGNIESVYSAIEQCISINLKPVKINTVVIKGINDDEIGDFINLTKEMPVHVRFIELMPIGEGIRFYKDGFISSAEILKEHPELIFLESKKGQTANIYKAKGSKGTVQFISPVDCKFCNSCNRIRLTSKGAVKPCLHSQKEFQIKPYIYSEELLKAAIKSAIMNKPFEHKLEVENKSECTKGMFQIGG